MFPELFKFDSLPKEEPKKYVTLQVTTAEDIINEYYRIIALPEPMEELDRYVEKNIKSLLDYAVMTKEQRSLSILITDQFLDTVIKLVTAGKVSLTDDYIHKMNRVCYDYMKSVNKNLFTQTKLTEVAYNLNKKIVTALLGLQLTTEQATYLVCARYSTATDIKFNFKRVVRTIQSMPSSIMTEQNIVNIFAKLCPSPVTELFIAVMLDSFDDFYSKEEEYVYSTVSLAILDVLESLPLRDIQKVLTSYAYAVANQLRRPRFMLKSINQGDYPRINEIIDLVESTGINLY